MILTTLALAITMQSSQSAPPAGAPGPMANEVTGAIGEVRWVRRPEPEYPETALDLGVSGRAQLLCIQQDHRLSGCVVEAESPPGYGFGAAASRAARNSQTAGTEPRARLVINFRHPGW
ncbi:MAG: hypothetical protein REJ23_13770 [Brevundimonas sp.]|nr:hypothetical protein [Brevundimonas sp.]